MDTPSGYGFWPNDPLNQTGVDTQKQAVTWLTKGANDENATALANYNSACNAWLATALFRSPAPPKPTQPQEVKIDIIPGVSGTLVGVFLGIIPDGNLLGTPCPDPVVQPMPAANPIGPEEPNGTFQNMSVWTGQPFYPAGYVYTDASGQQYKQQVSESPFKNQGVTIMYAWWVKQ